MNDCFGVEFVADTDNFVVVDIETTGLRAKNSEIIEIAALKVKEGSVIEEFQTFVKPKVPVSPEISAINGITNDMLTEAPNIKSATNNFLNFLGNNIIVGHNLEGFAFKFLSKALHTCDKKIHNDYIDLSSFADYCLWNKIPDYKLSTVTKYFSVSDDNNERALKDCYLIYHCYCKLVEMFRNEWDKDDYYEEYKEDFNKLINQSSKPINTLNLRKSLEYINDGAQDDPVLRCFVLLPLIKYEIENNCLEEFLSKELLCFKYDMHRGMYKRMSDGDYKQVKKDIEYCIANL